MEKNPIVNAGFPYTYGRTLCAVKRLICRYKGIIRAGETGSSQQGRNIPTLILGTGKRKVLLTGSIHGREYVTTGYLLRCAEEYAQSAFSKSAYENYNVCEILQEFSLYIVPMANPDSVEIALGRALPCVRSDDFVAYTFKNNARNVNLNANFPFEWESVPLRRHGGKAAASEKETRFLMNLCEKHKFEIALAFHIRGGCLYWRDNLNGQIEGDEALAKRIESHNGLKLCPPTEKAEDCAGGFENWFRWKYSKPAVCAELVSDETAPFDLVCREFEKHTEWEKTRTIPLVAVRE